MCMCSNYLHSPDDTVASTAMVLLVSPAARPHIERSMEPAILADARSIHLHRLTQSFCLSCVSTIAPLFPLCSTNGVTR